jgi:hypothetical protein
MIGKPSMLLILKTPKDIKSNPTFWSLADPHIYVHSNVLLNPSVTTVMLTHVQPTASGYFHGISMLH